MTMYKYLHYLILIFSEVILCHMEKKFDKICQEQTFQTWIIYTCITRYDYLIQEVWILARQDMNTYTTKYSWWCMNTCLTRYEYLHDGQPKSKSSWISSERENYVEDVHGFRFANFLTDRQKYWWDWTEKKKPNSKNV